MSTAKKNTVDKIAASRAKMENLARQIDAENDNFEFLCEELREEFKDRTGMDIHIGPQSTPRDAVIYGTIKSLKNSGMSYDEIGTKLNVRGHKTKTLDQWNGHAVKEFFENYQEEKPRRV